MIDVTSHTFDQLTPAQIAAWDELQQADPALASPYFRPEFTQLMSQVRDDVEVAVLTQQRETVGLFPFQRGPWGAAKPVGGRLSDFHGVIARAGLDWSVDELLRGCKLVSWDFHHLLAEQQQFQPYHCGAAGASHYLDLSDGFDAYLEEQVRQGKKELVKARRKERKLEREVGPLRFECHSLDESAFEQLALWKSAQYVRTGLTDVLSFSWVTDLLERVLGMQTPNFSGVLSALYAGDRLAAVHLGIRSDKVLHYWFPAYDVELSKYSPGVILISKLAQQSKELGFDRIDLGRGDEQFKVNLASAATLVADGSVDCRPVQRVLKQQWRKTRNWVRNSPLQGPARVPMALIRPVREWLSFR